MDMTTMKIHEEKLSMNGISMMMIYMTEGIIGCKTLQDPV